MNEVVYFSLSNGLMETYDQVADKIFTIWNITVQGLNLVIKPS